MKSAGKARSNGLYRHIRTSKEIIRNLLNDLNNNTIGIRIVWTLQDEENWNATHSFSGRIWGTSGILCMLCTLYLIKSVSKEACIKAK